MKSAGEEGGEVFGHAMEDAGFFDFYLQQFAGVLAQQLLSWTMEVWGESIGSRLLRVSVSQSSPGRLR